VCHDVNLIEEDKAVEDPEGRIIEQSSEDDLFEVLQSVRLVDLVPDDLILDLDNLSESGNLLEKLPV
jgi:hypothetical protein